MTLGPLLGDCAETGSSSGVGEAGGEAVDEANILACNRVLKMV